MIVDGTFETLLIKASIDGSEYSIDDVEFHQDGFAFTFYVDTEYAPFFNDGYRVSGLIDGTVVARGTVTSVTPTKEDDAPILRVVAAPPSYENLQANEMN